jgi:hypothetical protein
MHSWLPEPIPGLPAQIVGSHAAGLSANDVGSLHLFLLTGSQPEPAVAVSAAYCERPLRAKRSRFHPKGLLRLELRNNLRVPPVLSGRWSHAIVWVDVLKANRAYFQET